MITTKDVRSKYATVLDDSAGWKWSEDWAVEFDAWLADHDARIANEAGERALREWIEGWPTESGDGTFLQDVARDGLARADRLAAEREAGTGGSGE